MNETLEATARARFKSWFVDFDPVRAKAEGRPHPSLPSPTGRGDGGEGDIAALFPDGFEETEMGEVPRGWRISTVGEEVRVVGGTTPSTKEPAYWENGAFHWATPKDLASLSDPILLDTNRCVTELGLQQISSGLLPKGTVLLSSRAPIGYLAISEIPVGVNQGFIAMVCDGELPNHYAIPTMTTSCATVRSPARR